MNEQYDPLRLKVGNLNRLSSAKLRAVMQHYGHTNPTHCVNVLVDALYRALELDKKEANPKVCET